MKSVPEPVALLLVLALGFLGRMMRIETFRLGLVKSCGGHDCLVVGMYWSCNEAISQIVTMKKQKLSNTIVEMPKTEDEKRRRHYTSLRTRVKRPNCHRLVHERYLNSLSQNHKRSWQSWHQMHQLRLIFIVGMVSCRQRGHISAISVACYTIAAQAAQKSTHS